MAEVSKMASMSASQFLDKACKLENDGKPNLAEKALEIAINRDNKEHNENPNTASLPRN